MKMQKIKRLAALILIILLFLLFMFLLIPKKSYSGEFAAQGSRSYWQITPEEDLCFTKAASMYQVPVNVLKSIAKVESGFNPYALNVNGVSYMPKDQNQAWSIIRANYGKSTDIGIMQVNTSWFKKLDVPYWYGLDACYNIMLGAYVLREKMNRFGNNWYGIAAYHSAEYYRNNRYAWMVYNNLKQIQNDSE